MTTYGTTDRVRAHTDAGVLARQDRAVRERLARVAGDPGALGHRVGALRRESDVERLLEGNASTLVVAGSALALLVDRRFALVPLVVGGFLLQHAVQGWCPPLGVLRRLGARTRQEIDRELIAAKALRGDFAEVRDAPGALAAAAR
jgi:hypothetical protein